MVKVLTQDDWDDIAKNQPSRYFTQSVDDGAVTVTFTSEVVAVEKGDEDSLNRIWEKEWTKVEANAMVSGEPKLYSLGGIDWSFFRDFRRECMKHGIMPSDLPGCIFKITKTGDWEQDIEYLGREGDIALPKAKELKIPDNKLKEAIDVIKDLKSNSPDLVKDEIPKADFIKIMGIRSTISTSLMASIIPELEKKDVLTVNKDKIKIK